MEPTVEPLAQMFRLNTALFANCLVDLDDVDATARPGPNSNSVAFIAAHLVESRAWMARYLGVQIPAPFGGLLEKVKSINELRSLPTLTEIKAAWEEVSGPIETRLGGLEADDLLASSSTKFPYVGPTVLGGIAFLVHHESYHVGQLAYLRKYLGLAPMSYR